MKSYRIITINTNKMYLFDVILFIGIIYRVDGVVFDRYSGKKVDVAEEKELRTKNATAQCSIEIRPCTPHEGSRIDGTCNNYKFQIRGSARGPYSRMLKTDYAYNRDIRMDKNGEPLPSARRVRTSLQTTGRVVDKMKLNMAAFHMLDFINRDISALNGPLDYLRRRQYCCEPIGTTDPRCIPIRVPDDDPYLKVTDIRCLNFSRAETFQDAGCTPDSIPPEQINFQTPVLDLSTIYGVDDEALAKVRKYEDGVLILERRGTRYVPPNITASDMPNITIGMLDGMKNKIIAGAKNNSAMGGLASEIANMLPNTTVEAVANAIPGVIGSLTPNIVSNIIPPIVNNLVSTIPSLITDTIPNLPNIIPGLVLNLPNAISESIPNVINIISTLIPGEVSLLIPNLVPNMTNEMIASALVDMLSNVISNALADSSANIIIDMIKNTVVNNTENICFQNNGTENICYQFGFPEVGNFDIRTTTLTIFFMREHNRLARALHEINPCWKDDRLFKVARKLNIATASNIFMYELLPTLLGYKNMVNYGLLSENIVHVAEYDVDAVPLVYAEYDNAVRFFNTMVDGRIKKFDEHYHYVDEYAFSDTLFRSGLIEADQNFEEINRGTFYQNSAKIDDILDPEISESYYGSIQRAHDAIAIGIQRGRDMGIRGYNDYRHLCGLKPAKKFEDFIDVMDKEKIEALKKLYNGKVDDVDLLAGISSENHIQGVLVGPTLFCIMTKQLQLFRFSDRFWFERGDQLHSFSIAQLHEMRKNNMARLACNNAEGIKHIQPEAFRNVRSGNEPVPCSHIPGPDIMKWFDESCVKHNYNHVTTHMPLNYKQKSIYSNRDSVSEFSSFFDSLLSYVPRV